MTISPTGKNPMPGNGEEYDDLTRIRGIGAVKQQSLHESLNIRTFQDLADLSVDEIESGLKAQGHKTSRSEIEQWIVQARELTAAAKRSPQQSVESLEAQPKASLNLPTEEGESSQLVKKPAENGKWKTCASFKVEFQSRNIEGQTEEQQTTVRYLEADQVKSWSGIESDRLCQWMLDWLRPQTMLTEPEAQKLVESTPVTVVIEQLRVLQPPQTETPMVADKANGLFSGFISSGKPFALEIFLRLTPSTAADITRGQIRYRTQLYARNRATGAITSVSDTMFEILDRGKLLYTTLLPAVTLQQPGMYRLQVLVTLQGVPAIPGCFEVPLLQVV